MPAEPPKAEEPKPAAEAKPAAETPVPPPALPRVIPGPVTTAPRFNDLMTAVIYGDPNTVQQLLSLGKWPDKPDSRGVTALMIAALFGDDASAEALLKAGANPNRPGPGGDTATSIARERQETAVLQLLQRYGGK
jgi:ankyrin repeat protein